MTAIAVQRVSIPAHVITVWLLPPAIAAAVACTRLAPWLVMLAISFSLYAFFKCLSWFGRPPMERPQRGWRAWAFFGWPGMDISPFQANGKAMAGPSVLKWSVAAAKTALGAVLAWVVKSAVSEDSKDS